MQSNWLRCFSESRQVKDLIIILLRQLIQRSLSMGHTYWANSQIHAEADLSACRIPIKSFHDEEVNLDSEETPHIPWSQPFLFCVRYVSEAFWALGNNSPHNGSYCCSVDDSIWPLLEYYLAEDDRCFFAVKAMPFQQLSVLAESDIPALIRKRTGDRACNGFNLRFEDCSIIDWFHSIIIRSMRDTELDELLADVAFRRRP